MKDWKNIQISEGDAGKGQGKQIDAELPNGKPVRILRTAAGYHVVVGKEMIDTGCTPPAVGSDKAWEIIKNASGE